MTNKHQHKEVVLKNHSGDEMAVDANCEEIDTPILPTPDVLERLDNLSPDILPWMLKETSLEAEHRRSLDLQRTSEGFRALKRGQIFGLIIGLLGIAGGSLVAIFSNSPGAGATIASIAIGTLAVTFATGKRPNE